MLQNIILNSQEKSINSSDINTIIDENGLSLSTSTPVKLLCNIDQMLLTCFYKGIPKYINESNCKYCNENKYRLNDEKVLCKKHYAIRLYHYKGTNLSRIVLRDIEFIMFGRYVKMEKDNCTYVFYISPIQIDNNRFRTFVYPKDIFDLSKSINYEWKLFNNYGVYTFSIVGEPYRLFYTDRFNAKFEKIERFTF